MPETGIILPEKKILFFFPQNPYPPRSGAHVRCLEILKGLVRQNCRVVFAYSNRYLEQSGDSETADYLREAGISDVRCFQGSFSEYLMSAAIRRTYLLFNQIPPLNSYKHTPPRMRSWFRDLQSEVRPDIIWMNYAHQDALIDRKSLRDTKTIIDYHDLVSINHRMQITIGRCFSRLRPFDVVNPAVLEESFLSDLNLSVDPAETAILASYDAIVAISKEESEHFLKGDDKKPVFFLPVTLPAAEIQNSYAGNAVFVTGPNVFNLQGYFYFIRKVLPSILHQEKDFSLSVIGAISGDVQAVPGIYLQGYIPNLEGMYLSARFAVCPVLGGTGQQIKIVEAMAYGIPVVATRYSAKTSPLVHGENGFVADNAREFAEYCVLLWREPGLCRQMGEAARMTIRKNCGEKQLQESLGKIFASV